VEENMKSILSIALAIFITGCASSTTQYYEAVTAAAQANAAASQAKFDALAKIAAAGDGQAASAAVMALALTQTPTVNPIPQQSQALQWASILATPVTSLGMMWMQADSAKTMAKYSADVDLARISADATTQQALYGSFVASNATTADVALGGFNAMGNIDYTPFINGMVDLGNAGINGAVNLGTAGFDSNVAISGAAITGLVDLGNAGLDSTLAMGTTGLDAATTLGTAGLASAVTLGTAGITGVTDVSTTGFGTLLSLDSGNNALLDGVWSQYTAAIAEIMANVPQLSCTVANNADGTSSVNCTP
jgi:hypothetical protein